KLAKQYHPDVNKDDPKAEAKFKEASEAYDILRDPQKRAAYDQFGHAAFNGGAGGMGGFGFDPGTAFSDIFEDLFGDLTGRRGGRQGAGRGSDLRHNMTITLAEAYKGKQSEIKVASSVTCDHCKGTGAEPGTSPVTCTTCRGQGRVRASQGFFTIERTCPQCQGRGQMIKDPCHTCGGIGRVQKERTLAVNIPAGVEDGTRIRLAGEGEAGVRGGPPGDLYIFLSIRPHEVFERDGHDLHARVPVSLATAALGGDVSVPTLDGSPAKIKLPEGTQTGRQFRLRGKGMPVLRSQAFGDLFIEVFVETPVNLTRKQKDLLKQFAAESSEHTHPETTSFADKLQSLTEAEE
ncbi:MAG TPA: molecular chaperone DnaJ, partial [Alphaproteobacteria bacterium]|nr:molecular chaperone DnaJ [Alphaproteobacteria bacterium]